MPATGRVRRPAYGRTSHVAAFLVVAALAACTPRSVAEAEQKKDVAWLAANGSPEAVAALGRLADGDRKAVAALESRAGRDVNTYIAAWTATTRGAPWGPQLLRGGLADPTRAELASSALPRRDPRLAPFVPDLEGAVVRLSAGHSGGVVAGLLASVGPPAHAAVERRLVDPKTRGAMCDGIGLPEASGDAKSLLLAVAPESRDHASCVSAVLEMAKTEDVVLAWIGSSAEPGLLTGAAKSGLACPRLATAWEKALVDRPPETHAALSVPLGLSIRRCASVLDPILADLFTRAPRARACIVRGIDPYGGELADMKLTCAALRRGWTRYESPRVRERAEDALTHGCSFAR